MTPSLSSEQPRACREAGLPSPLLPVTGTRRRRSMFALSQREGWLFGRDRQRAPREALRQLLLALEAQPERDIQLLPVSIYVGRAPNRQSGWLRALFSENWVVVGRFRRLLAILLNGRDTIVHFSTPISLRSALDEVPGERIERLQRKLARVLRVHFRRVRTTVIGPDLSHRRMVVDSVLNAESVRAAIAATASKENIPYATAWRRAQKLMREIAADYSPPFVRAVSFLLSNFWNKLYDGIAMHHFDKLRAIAPGHEVVYVPSHRSHADYVLLSYQLHHSGVVVPHVAAGVNLNLPALGPLLRRGGAFFLRRSFKGDALYSVVFKEYMAQLIDRGVSIEYFIEGGRSRTGRLLQPRAGMLAMTVRAFLRAPHYGRVALNFGEPVMLTPLLDEAAPEWRDATLKADERPDWLPKLIDTLAERIQIEVNRAADVNPINLLAVALLATPRHAMAEGDLLVQIELMKALLETLPYSQRTTVTPMSAAEVVAYGEQMGWITRTRHPLGDVLRVEGEQAILLSYFRNNVLHLFAGASWVACCFVNNRKLARASVLRLARLIYPFIQAELFLPWDADGFVARVQEILDFLVARGLLTARGEGRLLQRGPGQGDDAFQLRLLAHSLLQTFERYYIAIAALVKNGPGTLSTGQLENLCHLTAQRLSLLYEQSAPEFFDKSLFRGFIALLRERRVIRTDTDGKLDFDDTLVEVARDARVILAREVRDSILKITPDVVAEKPVDAARAA